MPSQIEGVRMPIHLIAVAAMGVPIIDNCDLERLGMYANEQRRWDFLVCGEPARGPRWNRLSDQSPRGVLAPL